MNRLLPLTALLALAACQQAPEPSNESVAATPTAAAPTPAPSASAASLARFVGHYPLDDVAGSRFLADPAVRAMVAGVVTEAAVRDRVLDRDVTATPIVSKDGRLLSFGCEPHNCGPHNWTIAIRADGSQGAVCYYDQDAGVARWYPAGAGEAPSAGCPSGDD